MRDICVTPPFERDLRTIPGDIHEALDEILPSLADNPLSMELSVAKLHGFHPPLWRLRLGRYRLVFSFDQASITLLRLRHRREVYRNLR